MTTSRRQFLVQSLAAGTLTSLGIGACGSPQNSPGPGGEGQPGAEKSAATGGKKRILILGGTGFLGPALIDATLNGFERVIEACVDQEVDFLLPSDSASSSSGRRWPHPQMTA